MKYIDIAKEVLDANAGQKLHPNLKKYLDQSDRMCSRARSALTSRQVIVSLIRQWQAQNPATLPLRDKL